MAMTRLAVCISVATALVTPAVALGESHQPPPSIAQYVETLPDSNGGTAVGSSFKTSKLSPKLQEKLAREGGSDAKRLQVIVSQAQFGAPQNTLTKSNSSPSKSASSGTSVDATSAAAKSAGHGFVLALVLVLLALAGMAAAIVLGVRRRGAD
jgi:hypothetical protein